MFTDWSAPQQFLQTSKRKSWFRLAH